MYSLFIKDCATDQEIQQCLISFFKDFNVSIAPFDMDNKQNEEILFESSALKGDVCVQLSIYSKVTYDTKKLVVAICKFFKTEVVISDDSDNPYSWILVSENGDEKKIYEKVDKPDEDTFLIKTDD